MVGQSGGPTAAINASLAGVIKGAIDNRDTITRLYGMRNGIEGFLAERLCDLSEMFSDSEGKPDEEKLDLLSATPASALGSCRKKLPPTDDREFYENLISLFRKYDIRYFFYIGGNDSMDTVAKLTEYLRTSDYEMRVMGVPKTIDNDLFGTDHCPGFASAAKYIATSLMEVGKDARVYDTGTVTIVECMGRHAGWLTGAAALANLTEKTVDLIYLPGRDFDMEQFLADIDKIWKANHNVLVAVSEGVHYADGTFVSEAKTSATDGFGHAQLGGLAGLLADRVKNDLGCKTRAVELSILQRCAAHCASGTDIAESFMSGKVAVESMLAGMTDKMVGFKCDRTNGYKCEPELFDLSSVANFEKKVPLEWINEAGNDVTQEFIDYALPLIQGETPMEKENGLPRFARLKKVFAE